MDKVYPSFEQLGPGVHVCWSMIEKCDRWKWGDKGRDWVAEWLDGWVTGWLGGWVARWLDGWMAGWLGGWVGRGRGEG